MSITNKALGGVKWSFIGNISNQITTFSIGILLARLLSPEEFGLIGMITVFLVLADTFVDSGFSQALIRKNNCTQEDYSTAFYFNLIASVVIYLLLFITAKYVAIFFSEVKLVSLIRVASLVMIINSFTLVQKTILIKEINFKIQTKVSVISTIVSGLIALSLAVYDFGVWSLVVKSIVASIVSTLLFWNYNKWRPSFIFNYNSFNELFSFGGKLLFSNLIDRLYWNTYYTAIGKYFSTEVLGFYTRAEMFKNMPSQTISSIINQVAFPVLVECQNNDDRFKRNFITILKTTVFLITFLVLLVGTLSERLVETLIGVKWLQSAYYLKLLCFSGIAFPASLLNVTVLKILNKGDIILKIEPLKKISALPSIFFGIYFGIETMIIYLIFHSIFELYVNIYFVSTVIKINPISQIFELLSSIILPFFVCLIIYLLSIFLFQTYSLINFIALIILAFVILILLSEFTYNKEYLLIKTKFKSFLVS